MAVTAASLALGMAYSLWWAPVVRHASYWVYPADIWSTYRSAHFIGWGDLGGVYSAGTFLVSFPGILLALAPVAMLTSALGMSESFPRYLPHPTAWLVLGPYEIVLSGLALFAWDALAEQLEVPRRRRAALCVAGAVILWNVSVIWGHPEDAVAMGLAVYALTFALRGRWTGAGWLFGAAMATQPLVVLMLPVLVAAGGRRRAKGLLVRSALPSVVLLATPLLSQFHETVRAVVEQPNYPRLDHTTPWLTLAPRLGGTGEFYAVAAGPGRIVALVLACALGVALYRRPGRADVVVWASALALALRFITESVLVGFYVWPALAVGLVAAAKRGSARFLVGVVAAVLTTVIAQWHLGELAWWGIEMTGIGVVLAAGTPPRSPRPTNATVAAVVTGQSGEPQVLVGSAR